MLWRRARAAALAVCCATLAACASTSPPVGVGNPALAPTVATSTLPRIDVADLPPDAVAVLTLIALGGPFSYPKDGTVFSNRERLLPQSVAGFYREYTVVTPGVAGRGPRRIVAGEDGSRFWTTDHYSSFREIVAQRLATTP